MIFWSFFTILGLIAIVVVLMAVYFSCVLRWAEERTLGINYYGLLKEERAAFKRRLAFHATLLGPAIWLSSRSSMNFRDSRIQYKGVSAPAGSCDIAGFARAEAYVPQPEDVFVVSQMKSGTTWMQHLVFQIIHRGQGDLVESGRALYSVSPWLEGKKSVSINESRPIGTARKSRIVKTHLPAHLCPYDLAAKYIYVTRHPVSCFASCVDFIVNNVGTRSPGMSEFEEWYISEDLMWWGTWADHVKGWWARAGSHQDNVLFVYFEDMKRSLPFVVERVVAFLGMKPLAA